MPTFYDSNGKPYALSIEIGRGGEGTVFYCPNDLSLVAKIYHEAIDEEKSEKLRWMAANRNDGLLKVAAWIIDTLHNTPNGKIVGFLMPNVKAKEIHELYSLKSRRVHFPEATWQFLIHTATNVARAFYSLHKNDHIMGDVNHGNCVVLADGTVKLIDCDSYSIKTDKMRYRCDVGVATHLAPELQGIDLSEVEREKTHDNFGLAVIIFQLLFLGRHPFAGNYLGAEDKSLEDCIREHRFAYGNQQVTNVKQPPGTLALSQISPRLAMMFTRAFMTTDRPQAREWIEALDDLAKTLKQCTTHIGHYYFEELTVCPWCGIEAQTGLILFPFVSNESGEKGFNIFTVESLLASLEMPRNLPAKPFKTNVLPPPSPGALELQNSAKNRIASFAVIHFVLVLIWTFLGGASSGIALGIFLGFGFYFINQKLTKDAHEKLDLDLNEARQNWIKLENDWNNNRKQNLLDGDLSLIRQKIKQHQSLQREKIESLANFKEDFVQNHLRQYLSAYKLTDLNLRQNQVDALTRYGFQTAADIDEKRLRPMLALDNETKDYLIHWREDLVKDYKFDVNAEIPETAKNRFEIDFTEKRRAIEREIEQLLSILRAGATALQQKQQQMEATAQPLALRLLQAESDFKVVGKNTQLTAALLLITVLVPTFGSIFQGFTSPSRVTSNSGYGGGYGVGRASNVANATVDRALSLRTITTEPYNEPNDIKVNEKITDSEMYLMSANDRLKSSKLLYNQSLPLVAKKDYKKAEKKLSLAIKFANYETRILYLYADVLYNLQKYDESITQLKELLNIDSSVENARLLLGANYLRKDDFESAKTTFVGILDRNPRSFEANYNLGVVYAKQSYYGLAKPKFEKAIQIDSTNADAFYEYGICLDKLGDKTTAISIYRSLTYLDEAKAEKLRQILKTERFPSATQNSGNGSGIGFGNGSGGRYVIESDDPPPTPKPTPRRIN